MQLENNNTFCILPFVHLYAEPKGDMKPCCIASGFDDKLNLKNMSIDEAFNSPQMKELRKDMLEGKYNKVCNVCYEREKITNHSPRISFNQNTLWTLPNVESDYSVESQFQHVDVRFSNLCNFKCRMCNHDFSSNWYDDFFDLKPYYDKNDRPRVLKVSETIASDLKQHLNKIKSIYFAGGEPLIMPEHYEILKHLYDNTEIEIMYRDNDGIPEHFKTRNLSIHYNTNLSVIKYDETSLIDLWKGFYRVFLSISCDGIGKVGEYQRTGFNMERFEDNLKIIRKYAKPANVSEPLNGLLYNFQYTTTTMNVYHIFDFIEYMMKKEYITSSEQIDFYYSWTPLEFSLNQLNDTEKIKIVHFINENKEKYCDKTKGELDRIIDFVNSDNSFHQTELQNEARKQYIQKIDDMHGGNFYEISKINL